MALDDHANAVANVVQLCDLDKGADVIDILQIGDDIALIPVVLLEKGTGVGQGQLGLASD